MGTHGGKYPGVISTFGFGYSMDSPLLRAISHEGDGMYAFIPDSGFVGTAFVNALSNSLVTIAAHSVLSIEPGSGVEILEVMGNVTYTTQSWGVSIPAGTLQFGQTKDYVLRVRSPGPASLSATLKYTDLNKEAGFEQRTSEVTADGPGPTTISLSTNHVELEKCRLLVIATIDSILESLNARTDNLHQSRGFIQRTLNVVKASQGRFNAYPDAPPAGAYGSDQSRYQRQFAGLIKDLEGQISEATSRVDWYTKWGKHYLPSLKRAHELQQCNNFKDPGIQDYAGALFSTIRDRADDIFNSLPPPVASRPTSSYGGSRRSGLFSRSSAPSAPPASMASYNSSSAPCFHGESL